MVFVIQESEKNLSHALAYGELRFILKKQEHNFSPIPMVRAINKQLFNFSDEDYLLLIGDPMAIGIAITCAQRRNKGRVKILKWDRMQFTYYPLQLEF